MLINLCGGVLVGDPKNMPAGIYAQTQALYFIKYSRCGSINVSVQKSYATVSIHTVFLRFRVLGFWVQEHPSHLNCSSLCCVARPSQRPVLDDKPSTPLYPSNPRHPPQARDPPSLSSALCSPLPILPPRAPHLPRQHDPPHVHTSNPPLSGPNRLSPRPTSLSSAPGRQCTSCTLVRRSQALEAGLLPTAEVGGWF